MPILTLKVGERQPTKTLSAGEDLPNRDEINLMARPWADGSAAGLVKALFAQ
jgi:hypothetical protein